MTANEARIQIRIMLSSPSLSRHLSELEREALQYALDNWPVPRAIGEAQRFASDASLRRPTGY